MSNDEHEYVKVDLNETAQRAVCNITSIPTVCLQLYQTTFECAVHMCPYVLSIIVWDESYRYGYRWFLHIK